MPTILATILATIIIATGIATKRDLEAPLFQVIDYRRSTKLRASPARCPMVLPVRVGANQCGNGASVKAKPSVRVTGGFAVVCAFPIGKAPREELARGGGKRRAAVRLPSSAALRRSLLQEGCCANWPRKEKRRSRTDAGLSARTSLSSRRPQNKRSTAPESQPLHNRKATYDATITGLTIIPPSLRQLFIAINNYPQPYETLSTGVRRAF
jgi:hypothetical protein